MFWFTSYMILCTRSNSPSNDASRRRARGLNLTLRPWPVRSDDGFFRLVRFTCSKQHKRNSKENEPGVLLCDRCPGLMCCFIHTLGRVGGAGGDGEGETWPTEFWAGLQPLWLLLFWSSGLSGTGIGLDWVDGETPLPVSAAAVVSLDNSVVTAGGDKRRESEFRFWASLSAAAAATCLSPRSTFPLAEWMLSMSPKRQSGW